MTELITILGKIADDLEFQISIIDNEDEQAIREKADNYFKELSAFYKRVDRHRYAEISRFLNDRMQDDRDHLLAGIKCILECAQKNDYDKDEEGSDTRSCYVKICKLCDHIELEVLRLSSTSKIKAVADSYDKNKKNIDDLLAEAKTTLNDTERKAKNLSQQLISILGIFAGIIVTFSFATTIAGETVTNMAKGDVMHLCFVISLLGLIFINVIGLLMSFVGKLSGHRIQGAFPWAVYGIGTGLTTVAMIFFYFNM